MTLFQSRELESITREQSKYLSESVETLGKNKSKKTREAPYINREERILEQIHKLLEELGKQEIVKETLLEQLYAITLIQDDVTVKKVKEAIYVYATLEEGCYETRLVQL